ncbi:MAG: family 1 glycosylhydrolase [Gemmatimonadota bacterium]|nr:family 1 glycosylhydrolase [Gemmatimonadota bacterium]
MTRAREDSERIHRRGRRWVLGAIGGLLAAYLVATLAFRLSHPDLRFSVIPENPIVTGLPAGFLWGAATSAHQVEGGNLRNDWARFEAVPGNIRGGAGSGRAADHWNRVAQDVGLLRDLGANAYRFSIEWSRVEPDPGQWDESAWAHYADEVAQLRRAGVEPMVTLLHFTLPTWLTDRGGLTADDFAQRFAAFAAEAVRRLGADVRYWCTVNEPNVQMYQGYVVGVWPPGVQDRHQASRAFAGLVRGHALAAHAIKAARPGARVGAAVNLIVFDPVRRWWLLDWIGAREADRGFNWAFYDSVKRSAISLHIAGFPELDEPMTELAGSADFVGVNYYRRNLVRFSPRAPGLVELLQGPGPLSDTGVEIYPEGLLRLLRRVWDRYGLPIIVTENGVADSTGRLRPTYLRAHVYALARAVGEGIPVEGYFHWSLLDNFEWAEGFEPRFGLYRVDYDTQERVAGPGAVEFRRLVAIAAAAPWTR